jgi:hypothetical protein
MRILFTRSNKPGSKLIRSITEEPVSHCALLDGLYVIHSNFEGVNIVSYEQFKQDNKVIYSIIVPNSWAKMKRLMARFSDAGYDYGAFFYLGLSLVLRKWFKLPLPKANLWNSTGMFICTEFVSQYLNREGAAMLTPYQLYLEIKEHYERLDT